MNGSGCLNQECYHDRVYVFPHVTGASLLSWPESLCIPCVCFFCRNLQCLGRLQSFAAARVVCW